MCKTVTSSKNKIVWMIFAAVFTVHHPSLAPTVKDLAVPTVDSNVGQDSLSGVSVQPAEDGWREVQSVEG